MASERKVWFVAFRDGDDSFIAYGRDLTHLPVFEVGEESHRRTASMRFPSCTKFMPYADVSEPARMTLAQIRKRYGPALGRFETPRPGGYRSRRDL